MRSLSSTLRWLSLFTFLLFLGVHGLVAISNPDKVPHRLLCGQSTYTLEDFNAGTVTSFAPNRSNHILLGKNGSFLVFRGETEIGSIHLTDLSSNIEIVWSPDSQKFSITYSDGGAEGAFHAHLYEYTEESVAELSRPVDAAFSDFKRRYYCQKRGNNIFVEGWTPDSAKVMIVVQVYPTGDCGVIFGKLAGYLMDLKGNILRRYTEKQAQSIQSSCDKSGRASTLF
ncbi:MAG: hypothetical protein ACYDCG_14615 [Candidatus Acidiferrales bacterium]